jgi:hypothetical protein
MIGLPRRFHDATCKIVWHAGRSCRAKPQPCASSAAQRDKQAPFVPVTAVPAHETVLKTGHALVDGKVSRVSAAIGMAT